MISDQVIEPKQVAFGDDRFPRDEAGEADDDSRAGPAYLTAASQ